MATKRRERLITIDADALARLYQRLADKYLEIAHRESNPVKQASIDGQAKAYSDVAQRFSVMRGKQSWPARRKGR